MISPTSLPYSIAMFPSFVTVIQEYKNASFLTEVVFARVILPASSKAKAKIFPSVLACFVSPLSSVSVPVGHYTRM